jgi:hypothetical protein
MISERLLPSAVTNAANPIKIAIYRNAAVYLFLEIYISTNIIYIHTAFSHVSGIIILQSALSAHLVSAYNVSTRSNS